YGCARCHATAGVDASLRPGRPLAFASQANPDYLDRYLRDPQSIRPGTAMPSIGGKAAQIDADVPALVAYIKSIAAPKQVQLVPQDAIAAADADAREVPTPMTWVRMPENRPRRSMGMGGGRRDPMGWLGGPMGWPGSSMGWPGTGFRLPLPPVAPDTSKADALAAAETITTGAAREELISKGRERFRQLGCAACHAPQSPGRIDAARAPSLADVGAKWPEEYVRRFLLDPVGWHPQGNMPDFKLRPLDAAQLAAYLSTFTKYGDRQSTKNPFLGQPWESPFSDRWQPVSLESADGKSLVARGKTLVKERGCAACHLVDEIESPPAARLGPRCDLTVGCLRTDRSSGSGPQFHIPLADRLTAAEFLARRPQVSSPVAVHGHARRIIEERYGCYRCHVRDGQGGDDLSRAIFLHAAEDKTTDQVPLTPPDISGVGNRLRREWMLKVLVGDAPTARPWLKVRMPRFAMSEEEVSQVADLLAATDAIPPVTTPRPHELPKAMKAVAGQLLGGSGFSCINCHYVGTTPSSSETSAPDLTMITRRVDRDWFHRWLANPARIIPTTPMPAFKVPATKIAGEDLLVQKETVWQFLKHTPGSAIKKMMAESTTAVQVAGLRPSVVQGRLEGFVGRARGIAVGFSNGRSMAFDYERVAWRSAWKGGFLDEAGRHGAQHYWQPVGTQTWLSHDNGPPILYREKATGRWIGPALWRNRFGFVDRVTLIGRAVQIDYRLRAPGERTGTHEPKSWVRVTETIEPNPAGTERNGTTRTIRISGVPEAYDVIVQQSAGAIDAEYTVGTTPLDALPAAEKGLPLAKNPTLTIQQKSGRRWAVRISGDEAARWVAPPES
ncbi:MAG: c-type cytochrome, partial [Candidatus Nealsonbacteria bacterium]|nr:c-type cytochrome [Candidatus Nealsonbacteria bacterium]